MTKGRYGRHGGQYIPETLMNAVLELEKAYNKYKHDPEFLSELQDLYENYANRPSLLYYHERPQRCFPTPISCKMTSKSFYFRHCLRSSPQLLKISAAY